MAIFVPDGRQIVWSCIVGADVSIWTAFFWKRLLGSARTYEGVAVVTDQLQSILLAETRIELVNEP